MVMVRSKGTTELLSYFEDFQPALLQAPIDLQRVLFYQYQTLTNLSQLVTIGAGIWHLTF